MKKFLITTALTMTVTGGAIAGNFNPAIEDSIVIAPAECHILWGLLPCSTGPYHVNIRNGNGGGLFVFSNDGGNDGGNDDDSDDDDSVDGQDYPDTPDEPDTPDKSGHTG